MCCVIKTRCFYSKAKSLMDRNSTIYPGSQQAAGRPARLLHSQNEMSDRGDDDDDDKPPRAAHTKVKRRCVLKKF